jgi:DNA mismatch repair protein MutL
MGKIHLIEGYSKIAAGEVIERPASVVKELIENSLDASATKIFIALEDAGKRLIQIVDDGDGIPEEDVEIAFERHTSSKITSADELDRLNTLGFRGEALASIAAVSQIELITRTQAQAYAIRYVLNEGKKEVLEQAGGPIGTTLRVKNLFFNLPVRQKFMRNNKVELGHITDIICRYALAYPTIHFKLEHHGVAVINSPPWIPTMKIESPAKHQGGKKRTLNHAFPIEAYGHAIQTIYGKKIADAMIPIDNLDENTHIYGYIGTPDVARGEKNASSLFVNLRLVTNNAIAKTMEIAFEDYLMRNKYPFYVLFIDVPPETVDFNIHPSKKLVKFLDETEFFNRLQVILSDQVKSKLKTFSIAEKRADYSPTTAETVIDYWTPPQTDPQHQQLPKEYADMGVRASRHENASPATVRSNLHNQNPRNAAIIQRNEAAAPKKPTLGKSDLSKPTQLDLGTSQGNGTIMPHAPLNLSKTTLPVKNLPKLEFLDGGIQAGDTYLFFQNETGIVIIDQHAADERINYERVQEMFEANKVLTQQLLVPIKMDVAPNEVEFIKMAIEALGQYGFTLEHFGGNTFLIRTVPSFIKQLDHPTLIIDMCLEIVHMGQESSFSVLKKEIIQYMSCHQSVRAGEKISDFEKIKRLLFALDKVENPRHCAHGRPTYIEISFEELEKLFHRR